MRRVPDRSRILIVAGAVLLAGSAAGHARAATGELAVLAGPEYGVAPVGARRLNGYGAGGELAYALDDELSLTAGAHRLQHPADAGSTPFDVSFVHAGVRYAIDVLSVTPYVRADAARYLDRPTGGQGEVFGDWSVQGAMGLHWGRWRRGGLGAEVRFHDLLGRFAERPTYVTLWMFASWTAFAPSPRPHPPPPGGS